MLRKEKTDKVEKDKKEEREYMKYQQDLRQKFLSFIKEKMESDQRRHLADNKQAIIEQRFVKLRQDAEEKLLMIDEFKKTLDNYRWNTELEKIEAQKKQQIHDYFIEELKKDKNFRKETYAAEKLMQQEERMREKRLKVEYEHSKLLKEQRELMDNIELLISMNK